MCRRNFIKFPVEGRYDEWDENINYESSAPLSAQRAEMGTSLVHNCVEKMTESLVSISAHRTEVGTRVVKICVVKLAQMDCYHEHGHLQILLGQ